MATTTLGQITIVYRHETHQFKTVSLAEHFLQQLRNTLEAEHSPVMALATMRSDFLGLYQRNSVLRGLDFVQSERKQTAVTGRE